MFGKEKSLIILKKIHKNDIVNLEMEMVYMRSVIAKMTETYQDMVSKQFEDMFKTYFSTPQYVKIIRVQYYSMAVNCKSIDALIKIQNIEDAYSIFRKYIETFILMYSVVVHPDTALKFVNHTNYLSQKSQGGLPYEVKNMLRDKPDGYLQYGYLEDYVDTNVEDFRYSLKSVAEASGIEKFYTWYQITNNFIHNNTMNLSVNVEEGAAKLVSMINETQAQFVSVLKDIIKKKSVGLI